MSFDKYQTAFERAREAMCDELDSKTALPQLERIALKLAYVFEMDWAEPPPQDIRWAFNILVAKVIAELMAFNSSVRGFSLLGAQHHLRAVMEVRAAAHHLFADREHTQRRVMHLLTFPEVVPWRWMRQLDRLFGAQKISKEEFERLRRNVPDAQMSAFTPQRIEQLEAQLECKKGKLAERTNWHQGQIRDLFDDMDKSGLAWTHYQRQCHATHVSPIGHRLANRNALLGYELPLVIVSIHKMFDDLCATLELLDKALGSTLVGGLQAELHACMDAMERSAALIKQPTA